MANTLPILIVSGDPNFPHEFQDALSDIAGSIVVPHFATSENAAAETARAVHPALVVVDTADDPKGLRHFIDELHVAAPGTAVAVAFRRELFRPDVSEAAFFTEAIRAGARDFLRRPLSSADVSQLLLRVGRVAAVVPRKATVVSFVSNKGGVGKSTTAVSVACLLARRHPDQVLLIDASLQMGVCAPLLNLQPETTLADCVREAGRLDEALLRKFAARHACGLHLLACPPLPEDAAGVDDQMLSRIITLARRTYSFVVIDTFPLLDRVILAALDLSHRAFIVLESVVPTVIGTEKLLRLLDRVQYPAARQSVVLNRYDRGAGGPTPADVARRLDRPVDFVIPYTRKIVVAANLGDPYALRASRWWGFGKALHALTESIENLSARRQARLTSTDTAHDA